MVGPWVSLGSAVSELKPSRVKHEPYLLLLRSVPGLKTRPTTEGYACLSASVGAMRSARRAGSMHAISPTLNMIADVPISAL